MIGHGGPKTSRKPRLPVARRATAATRFCCAAARLVAVLWLLGTQTAIADDLRLRIAWGGGAERIWQGTIALSEGTLSDPQSLGIEADEPGSMWLEKSPAGGTAKLFICQRSPRTYDAVDLLVSAPPSAKLLVQLSTADNANRSKLLESNRLKTIEIPLADLSAAFVAKPLDDQDNRLVAMRAPGDSLRVRIVRDHLVFAPGEAFSFAVEPRALSLPKGSNARIKVQLIGGGKEFWAKQYDVQADRAEAIPVEIPLPNAEGVYDVVITAANNPDWSQAVRQPLNWKRTIAERRVQLAVLDPRRPTAPADREFAPIVEIDPANPRWFEKLNEKLDRLPQLPLTKGQLPRLWKGPLGNDCLQLRRHALGTLAELRPNANSPNVSWQAYWLPIGQPGRPHVLEVEYPSDVSQTLGLCILEPDAAGAMSPIGVDSGVDNAAEVVATDQSPRWLRHRMIFWPRTTTPLLLVSNGREQTPAVYGKIRVLSGAEHLPRAMAEQGENKDGDKNGDKGWIKAGDKNGGKSVNKRRLLAAYLDRPLIPETFAADESLDPQSGRSRHDWRTFYEGGARLVEYLNHAGYNGLMLTVLADGSSLYPSRLVEPTPRYDTGVFFGSGQDPIRKDVLEMLFRLFDREDLQLIPAVEFASPLPELEAVRRAGGAEAQGIEWIGVNGTNRLSTWPPQRGLAPYYNVLNPRVQQAMLRVVRELASRYARHASFRGMALRLSANGYAQLPGPDWGLDDATIAEFIRDTGMNIPGNDSISGNISGNGKSAQRFAQRAAFFADPSNRRVWLQWRAAQLAKFHRRVHDEIASIRPGCRLYLAGAGMIGGDEMEAELRPMLPRQTSVASTLLRVGIDIRQYRDDAQDIVLLRPEHIAPQTDLGSRAADVEIGQMADIDRYFQAANVAGSLFFHQPREIHIESLDQKNPFRPGYSWLLAQPSPSGSQNRRRFVHALATLDAQVMIDGGWVLSTGQEAAVRDLVAAYRALPAVPFHSVHSDANNREGSDDSQPVAFRCGTADGRTYLYAVNDAPFAATARIHVEAGATCRIKELTGRRKIEPLKPESTTGLYWEVSLEPYDLAAVELSEPDARCSNPQATWPGTIETALGEKIHRLSAMAGALRNPPPLEVLANPGFERPAANDGQIPDWAITTRKGISIQLDKTQKHGGQQSVRIASTGPVACLESRPFAAPSTGRLAVSVWLRVADAKKQPPLRVALEGKLHGRDYYKFAEVGLGENGTKATAILPAWGQYVVQVNDLPLEGLYQLRVRFDLMGPGEVWVNDVQIFCLAFDRSEMVELSKIITLADVKLQQRQVGDCMHLLEGYWPQFLEENVPASAFVLPPETVSAKPPQPGEEKEKEKQPDRTGLWNRIKDLLPESLRR